MKSTFTTIATFQYSYEAHIVKGKLKSEGIEVFIADNITIDTDPLFSNAIGGVKLKVRTQDFEKAKKALNIISKYSLDNDGNNILCPKCSSNKVNYFSTIKNKKSFFWFIIGLLTTSLPLHTKHKYKCMDCKNEFEI